LRLRGIINTSRIIKNVEERRGPGRNLLENKQAKKLIFFGASALLNIIDASGGVYYSPQPQTL
jgi:hypothetical protein